MRKISRSVSLTDRIGLFCGMKTRDEHATEDEICIVAGNRIVIPNPDAIERSMRQS